MVAEIFKIKDGKYVPTTNALGVPEFKLLWDNVEYPEIYFLYIHYSFYPISAYSELKEDEKREILLKDFPIDEENIYYVMASKKAEMLYATPLRRGFLSTKESYDNLSYAIKNQTTITFGRDGNASDIASYIKNSKDYMKSYMEAEKQYKEGISSYGSRDLGFDDSIVYEDLELDLN